MSTLVFAATYTTFDNLAHAPSGTMAPYSIYVYRLCERTGQLVLLTVTDGIENAAFLRFHPKLNILYACSESIFDDGIVAAYQINPETGELNLMSSASAEGTSTCYLTIDRELKHMLCVNYWNSTISTLTLDADGTVGPAIAVHKPPTSVVASSRQDHLENRQLEPHAHAIVLEPKEGKLAFVPDLGLDVIKQFVYDRSTGQLTPAGSFAAGPDELKPNGPRYIEFHPNLNIAYIVNELSSTISVFEFDPHVASDVVSNPQLSKPTLKFVQTISTIPTAFPKKLNTCGRIAMDPSGEFVLVSNRGHNSITTFRADQQSGQLELCGFFHTRGKTPRHFQLDQSGSWLVVANQDTDTVSIFQFSRKSGQLEFTGHTYDVPSPNFVCVVSPHA